MSGVFCFCEPCYTMLQRRFLHCVSYIYTALQNIKYSALEQVVFISGDDHGRVAQFTGNVSNKGFLAYRAPHYLPAPDELLLHTG